MFLVVMFWRDTLIYNRAPSLVFHLHIPMDAIGPLTQPSSLVFVHRCKDSLPTPSQSTIWAVSSASLLLASSLPIGLYPVRRRLGAEGESARDMATDARRAVP